MINNQHTPVLLKESMEFLVTNINGVYFEATLGFGGHSEAILNLLSGEGKLISTDVDIDAINFSKEKFAADKRIKIFNANFSQIDLIAKIESVKNFDGIFGDLGVSSFQLDNVLSGFTYRNEAKLDLRMDKTKAINASDVLNTFSGEEIADIIYQYGEEKKSRQIANRIVAQRKIKKIETTIDLADIIEEMTPFKYRIKTLSRVFQALRIYVNDELEMLKSFLTKSVDLLSEGGRIVILSYHSLEDRIVKEVFKYETLDCICPKDYPVCKCGKVPRLKILTKKPVVPSMLEIENNTRSRSAKLRAAERI
jgi:16S rRNA (cytosine1402-N4)-methyltransferase